MLKFLKKHLATGVSVNVCIKNIYSETLLSETPKDLLRFVFVYRKANSYWARIQYELVLFIETSRLEAAGDYKNRSLN